MAEESKKLAAPLIAPDTAPFWEAAREGRLLVKHCEGCAENHFYPRPRCPFCGSPRTQWLPTRGSGTVYSFSLQRGARRLTAPAIVELPEGPRLTTVIVDADVHALRIGDEVEVVFTPTEGGQPVPMFTTAAAQRARAYSRAALRSSSRIPGIEPGEHGRTIERAAVIGAGSMGIGIALALLGAGIAVRLIDRAEPALLRARQQIQQTLAGQAERSRITAEQAAERVAALHTSQDIADIADADLVIEAVWEQMALKQQVFAQIDAHAKPGALLGSNTSTLNIDEIAGVTRRPGAVVGLHFFSPAHVMKLLEVVRGPRTEPATIAAAMALGKRLGKVPVLVGICDGFVGNRLMITRERQAARLLIEGALPQQVDRVLTEFGMPMGTFELQDMAGGIELNYRHRQETGEQDWLIDRLFEAGRLGQKSGKGYYRYEPGKRKPLPDDEVTALIEEASRREGVRRRRLDDNEIRDRLILPMINEAAKLIEEGIVIRPSDIDVVWQYGYGWPDWKGGPVYHADRLGLAVVRERLWQLHGAHGEAFRPAVLLERLADRDESLLPKSDPV